MPYNEREPVAAEDEAEDIDEDLDSELNGDDAEGAEDGTADQADAA